MTTYECRIGEYIATIDAGSPEQAAEKCIKKRASDFSWFGSSNHYGASVIVDDVEYLPVEYADSTSPNVWGAR